MAVWACSGGPPGSSYRISLLLSGQVPGEAKMPSQMEGDLAGRGGEQYLHEARQRWAPRPVPHTDTWLLTPVWTLCEDPSGFRQQGALPTPRSGTLPLVYSHPFCEASQPGPHPWEQVRGSSPFPPSSPPRG